MYPPTDLVDDPLVDHFLDDNVESVRSKRKTLALRLASYPFGSSALAVSPYLHQELMQRAKDA
jgi:hypothetical protein